MTPTLQVVLDQQRDLIAQTQLHATAQPRRLAEIDQVLERKGERDGLAEGNVDVQLRLVDVGVRAEGGGAGADVAVAGELDAFFCAFDGDFSRTLVS